MSPFNPFSGAGPRWFSIDAHRPFLEDVADGVLAWLGGWKPGQGTPRASLAAQAAVTLHMVVAVGTSNGRAAIDHALHGLRERRGQRRGAVGAGVGDAGIGEA